MTDQHDDAASADADSAPEAPRAARVPDAMAGRRFDTVLAELFPEFSRSRLSAWVKSGDTPEAPKEEPRKETERKQ